MDKCEECGRSEANHPLYDGVGKIKCKEFIKEECQVCGNPEDEHPVYLGWNTETEVDIFCEKDKSVRKPSEVRK